VVSSVICKICDFTFINAPFTPSGYSSNTSHGEKTSRLDKEVMQTFRKPRNVPDDEFISRIKLYID
jgi:hypothetical protein